ncbi:2-amino-3,7-dideoxy-D-threo-hept-6-ulosonate synthase [Micromonospora sp. NPDC005215]|uniref:2-amino-3,7-dideoxy-D-threo-hept-6-ulosonate synthase n=1 Tax=Micromonospora sp. NPDC005215 TaxID=3157024 RepID=UPI0033A57CA3
MPPINNSFARSVRLRRLYRHADERLLVIPMDHSVTDGSISGGERLNRTVAALSGAGADAVVLHKGALRYVDGAAFADMSLIVHLSAGTTRAPDPDLKYLVTSVEEAVRLGADAVSVHVNLGADAESRQIIDLAEVARACDAWNVPLLAMMYPRGPRISDPRDPELIAHAVALAVDLGADIVKTVAPVTAAELRDVTRGCPVPVIVAGGPLRESAAELAAFTEQVLAGGAAGVAMGRNIFLHDDPGAAARQVCQIVHRPVLAVPAGAAGQFEPSVA